MRLDPSDQHVALEYAFLCYETKQEIAARRIFDRLRKSNTTAAQAFENIDRPLREGIERWQQALAVLQEGLRTLPEEDPARFLLPKRAFASALKPKPGA